MEGLGFDLNFEREPLRVQRLARSMCTSMFGDWEATGYEIREALIDSAKAALAVMDGRGYDITLLDTVERKIDSSTVVSGRHRLLAGRITYDDQGNIVDGHLRAAALRRLEEGNS